MIGKSELFLTRVQLHIFEVRTLLQKWDSNVIVTSFTYKTKAE